MTSVDNRVVQMQFDNNQFEKGVSQSIQSLDKLDQATQLPSGTKGFDKIQQAASTFNTNNMQSALDSINQKFSVMGAVGFSVIQRITDSMINLVDRLGSTTFGQILSGGKVRALNLEQAYFQFEGLGMDSAAVMDDVSAAVDGTAYSLDQAAKVAAQFGASGMTAGTDMRNSLTAISGVAAMTDSSYEDIGNIFTKVAGQGRLMGDDLLSLSSRGVNAAAVLAKQMGVSEAQVRDMVTKGKISFQDFANAMDSAFGEHATKANETFEGALANVKAALSRIGAKFYTPFYENAKDVLNAIRVDINNFSAALDPIFAEVTKGMTASKDVLVKFFNGIDMKPLTSTLSDAAKVMDQFYLAITKVFQIGEATDKYIQEGPYLTIVSLKYVIMGLGNIITNVINVVKAIGDAFSQVFSPTMLKPLSTLALLFETFTYKIKIGDDALNTIKDTFVAFFTIVKNVGEIVGAVLSGAFTILTPIFNYVGQALLFVVNAIGGFIRIVAKAEPSVSGITSGIKQFSDGVADLLSHFLSIQDPLGKFGVFLQSLSLVMRVVIKSFAQSVKTVYSTLSEVFSPVTSLLSDIGKAIYDFFSGMKIGEVAAGGGIAALITAGAYQIVSLILKLRYTLQGEDGAFNIGVFKKINSALFELKGTLVAYQDSLKAKTITSIAIAIGILAASILVLSRIDPQQMDTALVGMGVLMYEMVALLNAIKDTKPQDLIPTAFGIALIGIALNELADAVLKLSKCDWQGLAKGLISVGLLLGMITAMSYAFSKIEGSTIRGAGAILVISAAMIVMAEAIKKLGEIPYDTLSQGMETLAVVLLLLTIALNAFDGVKAVGGAVSMAIIASALIILSVALERFGQIPAEQLSQGMNVLAVSLALMMLAVNGMSGGIGGALSMLIISAALLVLYQAISMFGNMDINKLVQGLWALIIVLAAFAGVTLLLSTVSIQALAIAAAFLIFASGVLVLAVALDIMTIGLNGLLAAGLPALGMLALLAVALIPLALLGPILALTGVGMLSIGVGILALSVGLTSLAALSTVAVASIIESVTELVQGLIGLVPTIASALAEGVAAFLSTLIGLITQMIPIIVQLVSAIITGLSTLVPQIVQLAVTIVSSFIQGLSVVVPQLINLAFTIIMAFLDALNANLPMIIAEGINILETLIMGIGEAAAGLAQAAFDAMILFINSLANALVNNYDTFKGAIQNLLGAIGVVAGEMAGDIFSTGGGITQKLADGIGGAIDAITTAAHNLVWGFINGIGDLRDNVFNAGKGVGEQGVDGVNEGAGNASPSHKTYKSGIYLGQGFINGIVYMMDSVSKTGQALGQTAVSAVSNAMTAMSFDSTGLTPTITPVLDLSNMNRSYAIAGASLSDLNVNGNVQMAQSVAYKIDDKNDKYTQSTNAVIDKLGDLDKRLEYLETITPAINDLGDRIDGMEVKMEAVPVGKIVAPTVSREIEKESVRSSR